MFTFSSETASLIKFLSVAAVVPSTCRNCSKKAGSRRVEASESESCANSNSENDLEGSSLVHSKQSDKPETRDSVMSNQLGAGLLSIGKSVQDLKPGTSCSQSQSIESALSDIENGSSYKTKENLKAEEVQTLRSEDSETNLITKPKKIKVDCSAVHPNSSKGVGVKCSVCCSELQTDKLSSSSCTCAIDTDSHSKVSEIEHKCFDDVNSIIELSEQSKNLIFVTGEFAVALHQLGFKNVPSFNENSSRRRTLSEGNLGEGHMVVNYSNNDIHIVQRQDSPDKPDNLIDLFGHVTGLCLSEDQR